MSGDPLEVAVARLETRADQSDKDATALWKAKERHDARLDKLEAFQNRLVPLLVIATAIITGAVSLWLNNLPHP